MRVLFLQSQIHRLVMKINDREEGSALKYCIIAHEAC
jgi:hypothetical protein